MVPGLAQMLDPELVSSALLLAPMYNDHCIVYDHPVLHKYFLEYKDPEE
jgi:hypothetical protein